MENSILFLKSLFKINNKTKVDKLNAIFNNRGKRTQLCKLKEELNELIEQIDKHYNSDNLIYDYDFHQELADVLVMCNQFKLFIGYHIIEDIENKKIDRTLKRYSIDC